MVKNDAALAEKLASSPEAGTCTALAKLTSNIGFTTTLFIRGPSIPLGAEKIPIVPLKWKTLLSLP